ncbi:hypothetical protein ACFXDH_04855 [Streptomyces sp. NPDC059467]|uniref:hypothetical protein n=1 Tax=Streptomyces sp. NPDC059467 TaxID=3346844 RepID=UPI00367F74DC
MPGFPVRGSGPAVQEAGDPRLPGGLPVEDLLREARRDASLWSTRPGVRGAEGVVTALVDAGFTGVIRRVASVDGFVPLGKAAELVLVSEADAERAAGEMLSAGPDAHG